MKKIILILLFLLVACSSNKTNDINNTQLEKVGTKFVYENGKCLRDNLLVEYKTFNRNDNIVITDEDEEFYYINDNNLVLSIRKKFVRTENEEPFKQYNGYTKSGTHLFSDVELEDAVRTFSLNDEIEVIDSFADVLYVKYENEYGYMSSGSVSSSKIQEYVAPVAPVPSDSGSSKSKDDDGPSSSPAPSPAPEPSGPAETSGESDISIDDLAYTHHNNRVIPLTSGNIDAIVLADNTISYITKLSRNDVVFVIGEANDYYEILINGYKARIQTKYVRLDSEKAYESFDAYSESGTVLYEDFDCNKRITSLGINENIKIIDEVDGMYVVKLEDGTEAYTLKTNVSKEKIYIAPKVEVPSVDDSSGGKSDDDDGPSPAPAPSPAPEPEWTDEEL